MTRGLKSWLSKWWLSFAAGLGVLLVPTLFTVFPAWGEHWSVKAKVAALLLWLVAAAVAVISAVRQSQQLESLTTDASERDRIARTGAMERLISVVLAPGPAGLPDDYRFQVFLPNANRTLLIAEFDPAGVGPSEGWRIDQDPPQAVTGAAWTTNSYVFAKGDAVSDATYGLTPEQQARYRNLTGVAATPIQNARGHPIGVLTVCTAAPQPVLSDPDVIKRLVALSEIIARVLIDVGGKASDDSAGAACAPATISDMAIVIPSVPIQYPTLSVEDAANADAGRIPVTRQLVIEAVEEVIEEARPAFRPGGALEEAEDRRDPTRNAATHRRRS